MAEIRKVIHAELDITEKIVTGELSLTDVLAELTGPTSEPLTRHVLWDISQASFASTDSEDLRRIVAAVAEVVRYRPDGKSAVIAASDLSFGVSRMYQAYRESQGIELPYMSFRTRQAALDWLQQK